MSNNVERYYTKEELMDLNIHSLRSMLRRVFGGTPGDKNKETIVDTIIAYQNNENMPKRTARGRKARDKVITKPNIVNENIENEFVTSRTKHAEKFKVLKNFQELEIVKPHKRMDILQPSGIKSDCLNAFCPITKGSRVLIVSPQGGGKSTLCRSFIKNINKYEDEVVVIALLINQTPEEILNYREQCNCDIVSTNFCQNAQTHLFACESALFKAKNLVVEGKDVVLVFDCLSSLITIIEELGVVPNTTLKDDEIDVMPYAKQFFASAKATKNAGSLTIIASIEQTELVNNFTIDQFKSYAGVQICLNKNKYELGVFPNIDLLESYSRDSQLLLTASDAKTTQTFRAKLESNCLTEKQASHLLYSALSTKDLMDKISNEKQ